MINWNWEKELFDQNYDLIAGIDEAGRGPLAGPVVAGLVILQKNSAPDPDDENIKAIKDSKKLTPTRREKLFHFLRKNFFTAVGICDNRTIDRINIRQAAFLAMKKALGEAKPKPQFILIDGNAVIPSCSYGQKCIKQGDNSVFSIAAASIIAKVTRDKMMREIHDQYPDYGFDRHKGYGTKHHLENIKKYGVCPVHRRSFEPCRLDKITK
ncbi:MAG TPA: ribonuclease HII, partial [Patescibacteria group bacterium]|nr:ribonuclease HII [Patescibacteria group bacterium]